MMELLENPENRDYPTDYLLSRIKGRRACLIRDWKPLVFDVTPLEAVTVPGPRSLMADTSPEGVWKQLVKEYRWVYEQMNGTLREIFRPYFLYTELRTLFICLRRLKDRETEWNSELVRASLLSPAVKEVLETSADVPSAVAGIEEIFVSYSEKFRGLTECFDAGGLRDVEQRLTNTLLARILNMKLGPLMKIFFSRIVDARNILSLYKCLKLDIKTSPPFIPGGGISGRRLEEIRDKQDMFAVGSLVRGFSGIKVDIPDSTKVENALYRGITRFLRKSGREPFGAGPVLDYLWRCSIEAMNLSVLFYGTELEREAVLAELVQ